MSGISRTRSDFNYQQIAQQPEPPKQSGWSKFGKVLGDVGRGVMGNVPILGNTLSKVGVGTDFSKQEDLIKLQLEIQKATQTFSMISNINKAKHEASMTAVRNFEIDMDRNSKGQAANAASTTTSELGTACW